MTTPILSFQLPDQWTPTPTIVDSASPTIETPSATITNLSPTSTEMLGNNRPNNFTIIYALSENNDCKVISAPSSGGATQVLSTISSIGDCTSIKISPNGRQLIFDTYNGNTVTSYLADIDGKNQKKIFEGFGWYHWGAKWSPDGKRIAIQSSNSDDSVCEGSFDCTSLFIINQLKITDIKEVYVFVQNNSLKSISWSPDSQWIIFPSTSGEAVLLHVTDSTYYKPHIPSDALWPMDWSFDSKYITFITKLGCELPDYAKTGIGIYGLDKSEQVIEFPCDYFSYDHPERVFWTSDGDGFILYHSITKNLELIGKDGKLQKVIATINSWSNNIRWSPDGEWIVYREGTTIKAVNKDGTDSIVLINGVKNEFTLVEIE
jgi:dipeptidyl aminopeptidase/acylaminoacyl peptidase